MTPRITVFDECRACQGTGEIGMLRRTPDPQADARPCPECRGAGKVESDRMPTRAECYVELTRARCELRQALRDERPADELQRLWAYVDMAAAAHLAWVKADSIAAQAGALG